MRGKTRLPYPLEFREKIVELVRSGRTPGELAEDFEPSEQTIRNWVKQADVDAGRRKDGLTTEEREELRQLLRENRRLKLERDILKKAAAWFAGESGSIADGAGDKTTVGDRLRALNILAKYGFGADRSHHDEELVGLLAQVTARGLRWRRAAGGAARVLGQGDRRSYAGRGMMRRMAW